MNATTLRNWASHHPIQTRWILFGLYTTTGFLSFFLGLFVLGTGWYEAGWPLWVSFAAFGATVVVRIAWKEKAPSRQAWTLFHLSTVLIISSLNIYLGSRFSVEYGGDMLGGSTSVVAAAAARPAETLSEFSEESPRSRGWLTSLVGKAKHSVETLPGWAKVLITMVIILAVIAVGYFILLLSCVVACGDLALLAPILLIGGIGGAIFGGVVLIRMVWISKARRIQKKLDKLEKKRKKKSMKL
ncbi:MAG: hypothetical protein NWR72_08740 [Bacteroidia bacterium]|nr:hypothetical protein [Bacteroidia bacterium]